MKMLLLLLVWCDVMSAIEMFPLPWRTDRRTQRICPVFTAAILPLSSGNFIFLSKFRGKVNLAFRRNGSDCIEDRRCFLIFIRVTSSDHIRRLSIIIIIIVIVVAVDDNDHRAKKLSRSGEWKWNAFCRTSISLGLPHSWLISVVLTAKLHTVICQWVDNN